MKRHFLFSVIGILLLASIMGCNMPSKDAASPTPNVTQAYQTVQARLTEAISQTPQTTPTPVRTITPQPTPSVNPPTAVTVTPTSIKTTAPDDLCNQALPGSPVDVTVPDNTIMQPGQQFTKTWRLQNAGTCTWSTEYALVWFSGEQFEAPSTVALTSEVSPGGTVDLSVDMKAPSAPGDHISYWKLRNGSGVLFGIGPQGGSAFWAKIIVQGTPVITGTPSTTVTVFPTQTATPGIKISGAATVQIGDFYDLDTNQANNGGEDLSYQLTNQNHVIAPLGNALLGVFGATTPTLQQCQSANLSAAPIIVDGLVGNYVCYRTNLGLPGWALIKGIDANSGALNLDILTWIVP
jgi:hypothetical protein